MVKVCKKTGNKKSSEMEETRVEYQAEEEEEEEDGADEELSSEEQDGGEDERKRRKLLEAISALGGKRKKPLGERSEAAVHMSEFTVSVEGEGDKMELSDLIGTAEKAPAVTAQSKKQLRNLQRSNRTVECPLSKQERERIQRDVAFQKAASEVSRWDSVITQNQRAEQLVFPLNQEPSGPKPMERVVMGWKARTPLEQEVFALLTANKQPVTDPILTPAEEASVRAMSLEEAKVRRAELQKARALQSYYEAKARRERKIKSKKYHKVQNKAKRKEFLHQFEQMVQTDPAAALEQLQKMEVARMQERMSLKHQNSGKWAKSKAIMAKYDEGARKAMQQQLEVNKDLTQKMVTSLSNKEEEEEQEEEEGDSEMLPDFVNDAQRDASNPWMRGKLSEEPAEREEGDTAGGGGGEEEEKEEVVEEEADEAGEEALLREFDSRRKLRQAQESDAAAEEQELEEEEERVEELEQKVEEQKEEEQRVEEQKEEEQRVEEQKEEEQRVEEKEEEQRVEEKEEEQRVEEKEEEQRVEEQEEEQRVEEKEEEQRVEEKEEEQRVEEKEQEKEQKVEEQKEEEQRVEEKEEEQREEQEEEQREEQEEEQEQRVEEKEEEQREEQEEDDEAAAESSDREEESISEFRNLFHGLRKEAGSRDGSSPLEEGLIRIRTVEDVELLTQGDTSAPVEQPSASEPAPSAGQQAAKGRKRKKGIELKEVLTKETKVIKVPLAPTVADSDSSEEKLDQRGLIKEAFAGDDVISDFLRDKRRQEDAGKPRVVDLTLPGWGEWGGLGLKPSSRKRRRFRVKTAPPAPRKDQHLPSVIISEKRNSSISLHQVNSLPFPFENHSQFESAVRSPLGRTWNTERTVKKVTKPKVLTQLGAIIEPMAEEELVRDKKKASVGRSRRADSKKARL
ncbi:U3 small nucleolar RNA-associated protein 14 homolog A [Leuresthes tenuis]|uniref:U3 small nucleolar RNA-associated protein 14 homolog A n=1 Tax=Leuresthes tenuis TaxID=355514 RepID=UPI003B50265D